jgi:selenocysteine lyase/cysteine desulfurase
MSALGTALARREDFPVLDELTYLNTASLGLIPTPVQDEARVFDREIASRGTTWFDEDEEVGVLERARAAAGRLFNVEPELIAVSSSATEMLCQIAQHLRPGAGTNIVSIDLEFPSAVYPWARVAEESGAELRLVEAISDPANLSVAAVAELVDEATSVICVSHVQYATGCILGLAQLSELARAYDAKLVVDATQSAGMVPIDLHAVHVDALVAGGYKRLCGPFGAAVGYVHPEVLDGLRPLFVGWRSTPDPYHLDAREMPFAASARRLEFSTMSYTAGQALGGAMEYILELGIDRVNEYVSALADRLIAGLDDLGAELLTPRDPASRAGTVTVRFPGHDGGSVTRALQGADVIVSPRFQSTRFSPHVFNTAADIDRALDVLGGILSGHTA